MTRPAPDGVHYVSHPPGDGLGEAAQGHIDLLRNAGVPVSWTPLVWGANGLEPFTGEPPAAWRHGDLIVRPAGDTVVLHVL